MSEPAQRQVAICWLLLKGGHWIPVSPDRRLTARDRSSPDGPLIMAELVAEFDQLPRSGKTMYGFAVGVYPTDQPTLPSGGE